MNPLSRWLESLRRAARWDEAQSEDGEIARLRSLFDATRGEAPGYDEHLWERLRPQLEHHEEAVPNPFSFMMALSASGPKFALAAVCVMIFVAGLYMSGADSLPGPQAPLATTSTDAGNPLSAALGSPNQVIGERLEIQSGPELLRYIAYSSETR